MNNNTTQAVINYKPIDIEFNWTGDGYGNSRAVNIKQMKRVGDVALYTKTLVDGSVIYEVIIINRHNGYTLGGQYVAPAESYPGKSQWGRFGFTCIDLWRAEELFDEKVVEQNKKSEEAAKDAANGITKKRRGRPRKV